MLQVDHVTKKYGDFTALADITLQFENGLYGLLAPNGAGKTTLLKMLATLLYPTEGEILWDGQEISSMDAAYRDLLGYLPQHFGYYKNDTPKAFLGYLAALKGLERHQAGQRIDQLLDLVGLSAYANQKMKKFSGGMIQRVGIAQAMLNDPKILILDEPTVGLDPKERVRFRNLLHTLSGSRIVILSTHIVSDLETIAHKIIMFRQHQLYCCEMPETLCHRLQGKVFEVPADAPYEGLLLAERQQDGQVIHRIYSEKQPVYGQCVPPGLEDVFLAVYQDEGV